MKKLKKLSLKKEIEREAEALEKEVSGRKAEKTIGDRIPTDSPAAFLA